MTKLQKPTLCLFDLDGTLVRHKNKKLIAQLERLDTLIHILTKPFKKSATMPTEMDLAVNVESNPLIHRIIHGVRAMRGINVDEVVEPEEGVVNFLKALKDLGILIGLSSNAYGRSYGKFILRRYSLRDYFDVLIFRENVRHGKPAPEPILRAIYRLGLDEKTSQTIWFVGDQAKDMKVALEAKKQLPDNWNLIPLAYGGIASTAHMYLSSKRERFQNISDQNFIKNFADLEGKLKQAL